MALIENQQAMVAQWKIHQGHFDPTDYERVYDLYMLAFDDEDLALDAEIEAAKALMKQETARR